MWRSELAGRCWGPFSIFFQMYTVVVSDNLVPGGSLKLDMTINWFGSLTSQLFRQQWLLLYFF